MATIDSAAPHFELIQHLDQAVTSDDGKVCCGKVKTVLEDLCRSGKPILSDHDMRPAPDRYARHLVHLDPEGRYSVLAMVWDKGQGTAIHDHAGMWCCECVYRGKIKVVSYEMEGDDDAGPVQFHAQETIMAGPGEAGALIPPFDHHTIENALDEPSVTIHVYGGEMTWCHVFVPTENGYEKVYRELAYTP